jgi:hypothetical protein
MLWGAKMKFYVLRLVDWLPSAEIITSRTPSAEIITSRTLLSGDGYYENSNISGMTFKINKSQGITWNAIFLKNSPCDCAARAYLYNKDIRELRKFFGKNSSTGEIITENFFLNHVLPVKTKYSGGKVVTKNVTVKKKNICYW